jgi:hypothetical protein
MYPTFNVKEGARRVVGRKLKRKGLLPDWVQSVVFDFGDFFALLLLSFAELFNPKLTIGIA